jgi:hypothetical protein
MSWIANITKILAVRCTICPAFGSDFDGDVYDSSVQRRLRIIGDNVLIPKNTKRRSRDQYKSKRAFKKINKRHR